MRCFRVFFFAENQPCLLSVRYFKDGCGQGVLRRLLQKSENHVHRLGYPRLRVPEHMGIYIQSRFRFRNCGQIEINRQVLLIIEGPPVYLLLFKIQIINVVSAAE